jgi:hypothetical protein
MELVSYSYGTALYGGEWIASRSDLYNPIANRYETEYIPWPFSIKESIEKTLSGI